MTPLQKLKTAILTLQAHYENTHLSSSLRRQLEAGAIEVLVECAIEALPSIQEAIRKNKERAQ